jgi:hypothetical protein
MSAPDRAETPGEGDRSPEQIRKDIDRTREELGATVAAVAERADVKKQTHAKAEELKSAAGAKAQRARRAVLENPLPVAIVGAILASLLLRRVLSR